MGVFDRFLEAGEDGREPVTTLSSDVYEHQPKKMGCVPACISMKLQDDGLMLKPGDVRSVHEMYNGPLDNDRIGTYPSEVGATFNAINAECGTDYRLTVFTGMGDAIENGDSHEIRDLQKLRDMGHDVRDGVPPLRYTSGKGGVTIEGVMTNAGESPMVWSNGHAVLLTGIKDGTFYKHDPLVGPNVPVTPSEERGIHHAYIMRDIREDARVIA